MQLVWEECDKGGTQRAKDFASESESEAIKCDAGSVWWETASGRVQLHSARCTETVGCTEATLLESDKPVGLSVCNLCPKHQAEYFKGRYQLKCSVTACNRLGQPEGGGLEFCEEHRTAHPPTSTSTPTLRRGHPGHVRDPGREEARLTVTRAKMRRSLRQDYVVDAEQKMIVRMRFRESCWEMFEKRRNGPPAAIAEDGGERQIPPHGHTPKSTGVQKSLARMGMINSPDRRETMTMLEEFLEQLVEAKELNLDEEDVRAQLASNYGLTVTDYTKNLYEQATEEQRKGTKGLTKFLAKWRKQVAAETPGRSRASSWSLVSNVGDGHTGNFGTPSSQAVSSAPSSATKPKEFAKIPPPGIYKPEDRKAGTGGPADGAPLMELAKAMQQQTSELATLVRAQTDAGSSSQGTLKGLGRTSEELVFLLRACGQYTDMEPTLPTPFYQLKPGRQRVSELQDSARKSLPG